jgi:hypothetical protein
MRSVHVSSKYCIVNDLWLYHASPALSVFPECAVLCSATRSISAEREDSGKLASKVAFVFVDLA